MSRTATQLSATPPQVVNNANKTTYPAIYVQYAHSRYAILFRMYTVKIGILTLNTLSIPDNTHYGAS